ncbi:hypothetical protein ONS95_008321 [Cadophora gregata]|uniref:uncharacterized protein n=1 Tax=Cadophora gregata TaxID=51156 RepID=UPI0026DC9CCC|nr:uncharacterized protein ONS95_008321 [Cadophora gregata]KAK0100367.1 hypothetical protein ONS96_007647 [Cadophora gregata f. sp. sojae]KAK0126741.1 hypothetical protein ONS95_008321 [Cadophora gregata]
MAESSTSSLPSLFREFAGLSTSPRKNRSDQSMKEPDFSSGFGRWKSSFTKKKRPKESHRHRQKFRSDDEDIETVKEERDYERKRLRRALRELEELRRDRDELDGQRHKATTDLKRLRKEDQMKKKKLEEYRLRFQDQEKTSDRLRAHLQSLRKEAADKDKRIDQLTRDEASSRSKTQRLRDKLKREREEVSRLQDDISDLRTQQNPVTDARDTATALRILRKNHDELGRQYEASQEDLKALKADIAQLENDYTRVRIERDDSKQQMIQVQAQNTIQAQDIEDLTKSKVDLEKTRDVVQPILQIGVDIRLRNLESARECLLKIKQAEKDRAIILSGNVAAHRPNGAVDAALFWAGLVPEDYLPEATRTFKKMYQVSPENYGCWSPMVLRMIDCQATIATVQVQHQFKKFDTSHLRDEHERLHNYLVSRQKRLSPEEFEVDEKAKKLLAKIEVIMEEIVDLSRGKGKGRKKSQAFEYIESEDEEIISKPGKQDTGVRVENDENDKAGDSSETISDEDEDSSEEDSDSSDESVSSEENENSEDDID